MMRCVNTGAIIAEACGVTASSLQILNDLDYGTWQWKSYDEVRSESLVLFSRWFTTPHLVQFPGEESLQDLLARTSDVLRFILERHIDDTVVLVGHESVNRALLLQLLDQPISAYWRLAQAPCAISEIEVIGECVRINRINDTTWEGAS
jgi:probable phosphoglycerate mutase